MATRKKAAVPTPPVEEASTNGKEPHILAGLIPGTLTDAGAFVPRGAIRRVPCDIYPGLKDFAVYFRTSVAWRVVRDDYECEGETPVERECKKLCAFIADFDGWNFADPVDGKPIPKPDPTDWRTFTPIVWIHGTLADLYPWLVGRGLNSALEQPSKN